MDMVGGVDIEEYPLDAGARVTESRFTEFIFRACAFFPDVA
jgi:hypothetical protein